MNPELILLSLSTLLQLVAVAFALRLIRTTGTPRAWLTLSGAFVLMLVRRMVSLTGFTLPSLATEAVALAISLLLLLGMVSLQAALQGRERDQTERAGALQALQESEQRYHFLADSMPQIVWTARPDGNLDYYNQRWYDYTGTTFEQTRDSGWQSVVHPDDLPNAVERWTHAFSTGAPYEVEYRFKRAEDGTYRWHLGRALPMRDAGGRIVFWVGTCTDIDDHRRALEERAGALEENARLLRTAREAADRQRVFVREILNIATEGRLCLCSESTDLPAPLDPIGQPLAISSASLEALRHQVADIAASVELPPERRDDLILATGEAAMNAVVHAGSGTAHVHADPDKGTVQVWIEDRGKGIEIDQLHRATLERGYTTAGTMGHGFWMILRTADRIWLLTTPSGTTVVLEQERASQETAWPDDDIEALLRSMP